MAAINRRRELLLLIILRRRLREKKAKRDFGFEKYAENGKRKVNITRLFEKRCFLTVSSFSECFFGMVGPKIFHKNARREAIGPGERLSVTLRYLVTGDAFSTIAANYRLSDTTVGRIVKETCSALWDVLFC